MDKRTFVGVGVGFLGVVFIGFVVLFLVFGLGGGGNIPNPFNYGTQYICEVTLKKPAIGDTFVYSTSCVWGDVCNPPLAFGDSVAKGNVELLVDDRLMDREVYNIVYGLLPPKDGYETRNLQACLPPGQHDVLLDVLNENGDRVTSPATWSVTAPAVTTTTTVPGVTTTVTSSTTTTTQHPVCVYGKLNNPNPPYPSSPLSSHPKIFDTWSPEFCLVGEGNSVWGTVYVVNLGADMSSSWGIEMQVVPKGTPPLFWVSPTQRLCDPNYPQNVHKLYKLNFKEELSLNLVSTGLSHNRDYDVYLCSANKCYHDEPVGNYAVEPYSGCRWTTSLTTR